MFEDFGSKLKGIAKITFGLGILLSFSAIIILCHIETELWWLGIILGAITFIESYITSLVLYTLGDIWADRALGILTMHKVKGNTEEEAEIGWRCSCGYLNFPAKTTCAACGNVGKI